MCSRLVDVLLLQQSLMNYFVLLVGSSAGTPLDDVTDNPDSEATHTSCQDGENNIWSLSVRGMEGARSSW